MEDLNKDEQLLYLKMKTELQESVDKRVSDHLDRDRNLIKNTISNASRVFIWIIGLFSILLTILGIKTYGDIKNAINNTAKTSIETELLKTDILKQYDSRARLLYLNSLIESLLLKIEKSKLEKYGRKDLPEQNAIFLVQSLENNNIDKDAFKGILTIFGNMRYNDEIREKLVSVIKNIISTEFDLSPNRTEKLSMLFTELYKFDYQEELKDAVRSYLRNEQENQAVRMASINYLKKIKDYDIIEDLEKLVKSKNDNIKNLSIKSLSYLDFKNDYIKEYIEENKKGQMNLTKASNILSILNESLDGIYSNHRKRWRFKPDDSIEKECKDLATNNIKYLIDKGVRFTFSHFSFSDETSDLSIYMSNRKSSFSGIDKDLFFKYHIESDIFNEVKSSQKDFIRYFNGINNVNSGLSDEEDARLVISVNDTTTINFIDTKVLGSDIKGNIVLELYDETKIIAKWWDFSGVFMKKEIKNLSNLEQFKLVSREEIINGRYWWQ